MTRRPQGLAQGLGPWLCSLRSSRAVLCPHPWISFLFPSHQLLVRAHFRSLNLGLCPGLPRAARSPISYAGGELGVPGN